MSNNALMNKSKTELVEIIFRKDDKEKCLRSKLDALTKENAELREQLSINSKSALTGSCIGNEKQKRTNCLGFLKRLFGK